MKTLPDIHKNSYTTIDNIYVKKNPKGSGRININKEQLK